MTKLPPPGVIKHNVSLFFYMFNALITSFWMIVLLAPLSSKTLIVFNGPDPFVVFTSANTMGTGFNLDFFVGLKCDKAYKSRHKVRFKEEYF